MSEVLYSIMRIIARIHNYIMHLNDRFEYNFSDKDMHFLVIGALGMIMIFVVYPLFKWLAQKDHIMVIAWIYVFTLILVITFAIEIGQKITNTGNMEFDDIVFGVLGFFAMFAAFAVIRGIYHGICWIMKHRLEEKPTVYDAARDDNMEDYIGFSRQSAVQENGEYEFNNEDLKIIEDAVKDMQHADTDNGEDNKL